MTFEVRNGCFGYKKTVPILKNISFCVESRQVLAVLGPNGVGKTTLLRSMMGMLPWTSGGSFLDGENIRDMTPGRLWREMAYVPQAKSFPFAFTVEEMILLGRSSRIGTFGTPEKADRERCERAMEELGIAHMRRKLCNQISGGELQMVLIARALCAEQRGHGAEREQAARERIGQLGRVAGHEHEQQAAQQRDQQRVSAAAAQQRKQRKDVGEPEPHRDHGQHGRQQAFEPLRAQGHGRQQRQFRHAAGRPAPVSR